MRLKLTLPRVPRHTEYGTGVSWVSSDECLSAGDDHQLLKWSAGEATPITTLPETIFPTDIQCYPRVNSGKGGQTNDVFALASSDQYFYLMSRATGRVEKKVDAHKGGVLSLRWSHDGSSLATCGEEGSVKIWSRNGMLRTTLAYNTQPVYALAWAADNQSILYTFGDHLCIRSLAAQGKKNSWKAHDALVLCVDWCAANNHIVSGGDDCKYKVWDSFGRPLYSSSAHDHGITSVAWQSSGALFAVGAFNMLRLCDQAGWSLSVDRPSTGSLNRISWSPDGTQLAAACANGHVLFANLVDARVEWQSYSAVQSKRKTIEIRDAANGSKEKVEIKDRITKMALAFDRLVVTTPTQLYIFSSSNWNTPTISDLKDPSVSLIRISSSYVALLSSSGVTTVSMDGRILSTIPLTGGRVELLNENTVSLSNDCLTVRDSIDHKVIRLMDPRNGKAAGDGKIGHSTNVTQLAIDQCGTLADRRVAFIDDNNDLMLACVQSFGARSTVMKLSAMVTSLAFHNSNAMLAALLDDKVAIYTYPSTVYHDNQLLPSTVINIELSGPTTSITSFSGNQVHLIRGDGANISSLVNPLPSAIHRAVTDNKWDMALRLCRHADDRAVWSMTAVMAQHARNVAVARVAYAAIEQAEKVHYLNNVSNNAKESNAELILASGNVTDAERIYLQSGATFKAIMLNIMLYRWQRALDLAIKNKVHIDTVLAYRQKYLEDFNWKETDKQFLHQATQIEVDWQHVQENVARERGKK